jgi:hypothetical protein
VELMHWLRAQWDRVAAATALAAGVVCLLLGWLGVSDTEYVAKQIPYVISDGLAGIFLLGVGTMLWLSADMRDEWRELRGLRVLMREHVAQNAQLASVLDRDLSASSFGSVPDVHTTTNGRP